MPYNDIYVYKDVVGGTGDGSSKENSKSAFDINDIAHGNRIFIRESTTPTEIPDWTSVTTPIVEGVPLFCICGYGEEPGDDGLVTLSMYSGGDIFPYQDRQGWLIFQVKSTGDEAYGAIGRSSTGLAGFVKCYFENTSTGSNVNNNAGDATTSPMYGCYGKSRGTAGAVFDANAIGCFADAIDAFGGITYSSGYNPTAIMYNVVKGSGSGNGIALSNVQTGGNFILWKNTIDNFDKGININETPNIAYVTFPTIANNLIANCNIGIQNDEPLVDGDYLAIVNNAVHSVTTEYVGPVASKKGTIINVTSDPFTDIANNNYQLNDSADGGNLLFGALIIGALRQSISKVFKINPMAIMLTKRF